MLRVDPEKSDSEQEKILIKKANKPLMERKRRARINKCLFEMKQMLVDDIKNGSPSHSKWEKADILEMSVAYIRQLRQRVAAHNKVQQSFSLSSFVNGFSDCVREMQNYTSLEKWPADLYEYNNRLTNHLIARLQLLISKPTAKDPTVGTRFILEIPEDPPPIYDNHATENLRAKSLSPPSCWECIGTTASEVHLNSPECSSHLRMATTLPPALQIPHQTISTRYPTTITAGTASTVCRPPEPKHVEKIYCGNEYPYSDNKFKNHFMGSRETLNTTCAGYRLWRPF